MSGNRCSKEEHLDTLVDWIKTFAAEFFFCNFQSRKTSCSCPDFAKLRPEPGLRFLNVQSAPPLDSIVSQVPFSELPAPQNVHFV